MLVPIEQDVLGFDVPMHYVPFMQVFECLCDGSEELFGLLFLHAVLRTGKQIIVKRVSASVLLDQVNLAAALNDINELGNDWMVELRQDVYLSL